MDSPRRWCRRRLHCQNKRTGSAFLFLILTNLAIHWTVAHQHYSAATSRRRAIGRRKKEQGWLMYNIKNRYRTLMVSARFVCCHNLLIYSHYNCIIARRYYLFTAHNHYHYNSVQECITITTIFNALFLIRRISYLNATAAPLSLLVLQICPCLLGRCSHPSVRKEKKLN